VAEDELTIDDYMAETGLPDGRPRRITMYQTPVLHAPCRPVTVFDDALKQLVADLFESMDLAEGVGLAANQIGVNAAVFVYDCPDADDVYRVGCVVNPVLVPLPADVPTVEEEEGCLSIPLEYTQLRRPAIATVTGVDLDGQPIRVDGTGLFARCLQHETDHINGVMFVDRLGLADRETLLSSHRHRVADKKLPPWSEGFTRQ
jgi:peptide deformylase